MRQCEGRNSGFTITVSELPYTEGTLYVSATCGDKELLKVAIEVEDDSIVIPVDFSEAIDKRCRYEPFRISMRTSS